MKKYLILIVFVPFIGFAQPNCKAYLYSGDTLQYKACLSVEDVPYYQFAREFHEKFDEALKICPHFAYACREKSTAYLKSGDFITWKQFIDKAVDYDWKSNLGYRGWCRYQFFKDYKGAIADIEKLDSLVKYDIGSGINGDYHLNITKAICYSAIGNKKKAIEIIENQLKTPNYEVGLYDYYQLGVCYFELNNYALALENFEQQSLKNQFAENEYYKAKIYKIQRNNNSFKQYKTLALSLYEQGKIMFDPYTAHFNKVYLEEIEVL